MLKFTKKEIELFKKLNTPAKIQDYLNRLPFNFERDGKDTIKSPILVLRTKNAHCLEGAIFAAYVLSRHGHRPMLMHLKTTKEDDEHVIAVYKKNGYWGAISKTNHSILRYREPVYKTPRELAMSFFHEYFLLNGHKTMRSYSEVLDLSIFEDGWEREENYLWGIDEELDRIKHHPVADKRNLRRLRKADKIEKKAVSIEEFAKNGKKKLQ